MDLLCFFEEITQWDDDGSPVDVIYIYILEFQKAFVIYLDFHIND